MATVTNHKITTKTEHTLYVSTDICAWDFRIPLPFAYEIEHGPFVRDDGSVAFTVRDMHPMEHEWPEGIEETNQTFGMPCGGGCKNCARAYRTDIMFPNLNDPEHAYHAILVDETGPYPTVHRVSPQEAARGDRWSHRAKLEKAEGWDHDAYLDAVVEEARSFYEGDVYGVIECLPTETGWKIDDVWGFIGSDHAEEVAKNGY